MAFFFVLIVIPGCFGCNARSAAANRAKIVEEYVVSANFDKNTNIPQLYERSQSREIYQEDEMQSKQETEGGSLPAPPSSRRNHRGEGEPLGAFDHRNTLEERDFLVHHHHLPAVPHPPPPPPPPVGLAYAPSLFAVGLITFLILLNSLQMSLLLMKPKGSLLGSVTGALGRRRRSISEEVAKLMEKYEKANSTWA